MIFYEKSDKYTTYFLLLFFLFFFIVYFLFTRDVPNLSIYIPIYSVFIIICYSFMIHSFHKALIMDTLLDKSRNGGHEKLTKKQKKKSKIKPKKKECYVWKNRQPKVVLL